MKRMISRATILAMAVSVGISSGVLAKQPDDKPPGNKPPHQMPQALIKWKMAKRTIGIDNETTRQFQPELEYAGVHRMLRGPGGEPGLYGGVSSVPLRQINPRRGYRVTLDACASTGNIQQYEWRIDGKRVSKSKNCRFSTRLNEGDYKVKLVVNGGGRKSSTSEDIEVKDLLFVIMGDSYTSGEGNPLIYNQDLAEYKTDLQDALANNGKGWSEGSFWDYANCHRSTRSGQLNALIDLENADPHTSVTTLFVACSGGQIDSGISGIKNGNLGGPEKPQTYQAYELAILNGREISGILIGIGGNDVGFVPVVGEGLLQPDVFLSTERPSLAPGTPDLPFIGAPVLVDEDTGEDEVPDLLLAPDGDYVDPSGDPPGPPMREMQALALHACESQFQKAAWGEGDLGPDQSCRHSIGTTEFGLADVNRCLTGDGLNDCEFARSYYNFDTAMWQYEDGSVVGVPDTWPGLGVDPDKVFYAEYPDLTTEFANFPSDLTLQYCDISLSKTEMLIILKLVQSQSDNPDLVQVLIDIVDSLPFTASFGLPANEFQWASEAVLNGPLDPLSKLLSYNMTSEWKVNTAPDPAGVFESYILGGNFADRVNLGNDAPALNEMTERSGAPMPLGYGWTAVIGGHDAASGHGLCTSQPTGDVITDLNAAYAYLIGPLAGTNTSGSAHPNLFGTKYVYQEPYAQALLAAFLSTP